MGESSVCAVENLDVVSSYQLFTRIYLSSVQIAAASRPSSASPNTVKSAFSGGRIHLPTTKTADWAPVLAHSLRIAQLSPLTEIAAIPDGYYPDWSPVTNKVAFVQGQKVMEYTIGGNSLPRLNAGTEIQWPVYSPNGLNIAFQMKQGSNWTIVFTSADPVPVMAGRDDTRPVWSPDGQAIVFIRTDPATRTSQLMMWNLWRPQHSDNTCRNFWC